LHGLDELGDLGREVGEAPLVGVEAQITSRFDGFPLGSTGGRRHVQLVAVSLGAARHRLGLGR
jgi:hypothetical protein